MLSLMCSVVMIHRFIGKFQPLSLTLQIRLMLIYGFLTTLFNENKS